MFGPPAALRFIYADRQSRAERRGTRADNLLAAEESSRRNCGSALRRVCRAPSPSCHLFLLSLSLHLLLSLPRVVDRFHQFRRGEVIGISAAELSRAEMDDLSRALALAITAVAVVVFEITCMPLIIEGAARNHHSYIGTVAHAILGPGLRRCAPSCLKYRPRQPP